MMPGFSLPLARSALAACLAAAACGCASLPSLDGRVESSALTATDDTVIGAAVAPLVYAHPGKTGVHAMPLGTDAFAARVLLAMRAQRSIDAQYYIWHADHTGTLLFDALVQAARRGVRVRILLDDQNTKGLDGLISAIAAEPNLEFRLYNPFAQRSARFTGYFGDFERLNRRMHNKAFIADNQVAMVGGRNIGDEYFDAGGEVPFKDLDVVALGVAVRDISREFDLYWNNQSSIPIAALARQNTTPEQFAAQRAALIAYHETAKASAYAQSLRDSEFARQIRNRSVPYYWGKATIVEDHPDKVATSAGKTETHLAPQLRKVVDQTKRELFLVSPYFVPGKKGVELLAGVRQRGVRVVVITNSLASTDGVPVHSKYQLYRKSLIEAGVEHYEIKPTTGAQPTRRFREPAGSSIGGLHAKTFAFDRRIGFIGSYNLDPRSSKLNTEMGVLFDCPLLAKRLPVETERKLSRDAYHVQLDGNRLIWVTREGDKEVRYYSEPHTDLMKRIEAGVISWLPIEWLL